MMELTDAMLRMFGPLRRFGVPVDDIAMMISIALRFIPTTAREAQMIQLAQKARCANFDDGNLFVRLKAWVPVFIPLFVRLFRRADDLADAMGRALLCGRTPHAHECDNAFRGRHRDAHHRHCCNRRALRVLVGEAEMSQQSLVLTIAYDGTAYAGFAKQKDEHVVTIQGELERALATYFRHPVETVCAGPHGCGCACARTSRVMRA